MSMRKPDNIGIATFKSFPFSISAYVLTMLCWAYIYFSQIHINFSPVPEGMRDYRGEGIMYGVIMVMLLSAILLLVTLINLGFQKNKAFYIKLSVLILISNALLYYIGLL